MGTSYDPVPDAIEFLAKRTALERHAIARILEPDGPSLGVLRWLVEQRSCDLATASMVFWRLLCLPAAEAQGSGSARVPVLEQIVANVGEKQYGESAIAWDGIEAWDGISLIGARPAGGVDLAEELPAELFGPFEGTAPEPATHAFFEVPYEQDDIFDSLWRVNPELIAAADWLIGKAADAWMAAVDDFASAHSEELFLWMVKRPECPTAVAGQIFWLSDPLFYARQELDASGRQHGSRVFGLLNAILERWRADGFRPTDLDFREYAQPAKYRDLLAKFPDQADPLQIPGDLLDPPTGRPRSTLNLHEDFDFHCIRAGFGNLVPRPRAAAILEWQKYLEWRTRKPVQDVAAQRPFADTKAKLDARWRKFNLAVGAGAVVMTAIWRAGFGRAAFAVFLALVVAVSVVLSSDRMGDRRRVKLWWLKVSVLAVGFAAFFRWIDFR